MKMSIIDSMIGHTIRAIRAMAFYIDLKLICDVIVLYIEVDTGKWYKLTSSDGKNIIEMSNEAPIEVNLKEVEDEFAYPVQTFASNYLDGKICGIKQYSCKNSEDEFNGFYIELDQGAGFSIFNENECLKIFDGIKLDESYPLV
jgi:hypothetical protein